MDSIEVRLKRLAEEFGADLIGITTTEILADGPPSSDPCYLLPTTKSVISFAISLDRDKAQDFISKKSWRPHCENRKEIVQKLYAVGDKLVDSLRAEGHEAVSVDLNNNYRPEKGSTDVTQMTEFHPEFSHRYAALASGVGRLGWSGNLLTREFGALVELGSVLTSAPLKADLPIPDEDHPCDRCMMCTLVCPVQMVQAKEQIEVTVAGITETISRKRPNTCCWIGCSGYEGLAASKTWSNWSPYRLELPLPPNKKDLDALCIDLQKGDPQMQDTENTFADYRQAVFNPDWFYYTVCGFCRSVCVQTKNGRIANQKAITTSGSAALKLDGSHVVADENAITLKTPFGLNVVVPRSELTPEKKHQPLPTHLFPLDREVIQYIKKHHLTFPSTPLSKG